MPDDLSAAQARRLAVAAQGLSGTRPGEANKRVDRRHFRRVLDQLGCVQLDSVNVVTRAHEVAFFARLGPYDRSALAWWLHRGGEVFEYWGHAASFLPVDLQPALRFKMDAARRGAAYGGLVQLMRERPDYLEDVRAAVRDRGPLVAADLHDGGERRRTEPWWGWDPPKRALEALFWCGDLSARRGARFERYYDLPERILPPAVVAAPTPPVDDQRRTLVRRGGCSGSTTASSSTCRRRSADTATTCSRSCSTTGWSPAWTSRPTAPGAGCSCSRRGSKPDTTPSGSRPR